MKEMKVGEIIVGGSQDNGFEWSNGDGTSNWGNAVDIVAGSHLITAIDYLPTANMGAGALAYTNAIGTSFATPMVSGTVAMVREKGGSVFSNPSTAPARARSIVIHSATLGTISTITSGKFLGMDLNNNMLKGNGTPLARSIDTTNERNTARVRELNVYNAISLAKQFASTPSGYPIVRLFNTDDDTWATKNWDWSLRWSIENYLNDSMWNLTADNYVSGNSISLYTYNSAGYHTCRKTSPFMAGIQGIL